MKKETTVPFESWFKEMKSASIAKELLNRISTFDGHTDAYQWLNDPKTTELFEEIRSFLKD